LTPTFFARIETTAAGWIKRTRQMSDHYETRCPSCGGSDEQGCYADCPTHHITALEARVRELEEALNDANTAIVDWLNIYAEDFCNRDRVKEAKARVGKYGTIHYIATVTATIRAALNQEKQK
jgi:hypothetical protein